MADSRFLKEGFENQLIHLVEECGEVLAAAGKTLKWGAWSVNPLLPEDKQEPNILWLKRELEDLKGAIARIEDTMEKEIL